MLITAILQAIDFSKIIFFHPTAADYDYEYFDTLSEHTEPNSTRAGWDGPWMLPPQNCVTQTHSLFTITLTLTAVTKNKKYSYDLLLFYY